MKTLSDSVSNCVCAMLLGCLVVGCQATEGPKLGASDAEARSAWPDLSLANPDFRLLLKIPNVIKSTERFEVTVAVVCCGSSGGVIDEGSLDPHLFFRRVGTSVWKDLEGNVEKNPFGPFESISLSRNWPIVLAPREGRGYQYNVDLSSFEPGIYDVAAVKYGDSCGVITALSKIELIR